VNPHSSPPKVRPTQWWARRSRVPLGFLTAALYLIACSLRSPHPAAIASSLALVLPGLALRAAAAGAVKKNQELAVTGPYAYTRNPLYLGSALIAAGFALALFSWVIALLILAGFAVIYIPVIALEEQFLRSAFPSFDGYCREVPRFIPRFTPAKINQANPLQPAATSVTIDAPRWFSPMLYMKHREYNAALGAALLYLSLLFLHPVLERVRHGVR
jgi:hypothetical protein